MGSNLKPPDGGWGWVIVLCSHLNHVGTVGLMMSLSVLYVSWLDQFGQSKGDTSWIISIAVTCMFGLCPIPAALANRFGFRLVGVLGALLIFLGLLVSVFATSVTYLIVSVGLITGIGCCFCYLPAVTVPAMYFEKRRCLAMGLATAGTGVGAFGFSPLLVYLEEQYGWRGAVLIMAAIHLNLCATGLILKPMDEGHPCVTGEGETTMPEEYSLEEEGLMQSHHSTDGRATYADLSLLSTDSGTDDKQVIVVSEDIAFKSTLHDGVEYGVGGDETLATNSIDVGDIGERRKYPSLLGDNLKSSRLTPPSDDHRMHVSLGDLPSRIGSDVTTCHHRHHHSFQHLDDHMKVRRTEDSLIKSIRNIDLPLLASMPRLYDDFTKGTDAGKASCDNITISNSLDAGCESAADGKCNGAPSKPERKRKFALNRCFNSSTLRTQINLLKDKPFLALCVSNFFTNLTFIAPVVYMVDRAVFEGIDKSTSAILVSANGIGNIFGRLVFGFLTDGVCSNRLLIYISALVVSGVGTALSNFCGNVAVLHAAYAIFFGFLMGTYTVLVPVVTIDLMGMTQIATAYGLVLFFEGSPAIIGPPLAGWLFDWTDSYDISYIVMGVFLMVSGLMLLPLLCLMTKRRLKREQEELVVNSPESDHNTPA